MRKPKPSAYRRHAASGQAIVTLSDNLTKRRRDYLLGFHGSADSRQRYDELVSDWLKAARRR